MRNPSCHRCSCRGPWALEWRGGALRGSTGRHEQTRGPRSWFRSLAGPRCRASPRGKGLGAFSFAIPGAQSRGWVGGQRAPSDSSVVEPGAGILGEKLYPGLPYFRPSEADRSLYAHRRPSRCAQKAVTGPLATSGVPLGQTGNLYAGYRGADLTAAIESTSRGRCPVERPLNPWTFPDILARPPVSQLALPLELIGPPCAFLSLF